MSSAAKHVLHEALLWGAVALSGFGLFYFFDDLRAAFGPGADTARRRRAARERDQAAGFAREVRLKADPRGHFMFDAAINDRPATFMADTGATLVVLTYEDAARLGLSPHSLDFSGWPRPPMAWRAWRPSRSTASASTTSSCATCPPWSPREARSTPICSA